MLEPQQPDSLQQIRHLEDAAKYQRSEFVETIVTQKPRFVTQLTGPERLMEGQSAHMECRIEPYPDPDLKVEWFLNGTPLQTGIQMNLLSTFKAHDLLLTLQLTFLQLTDSVQHMILDLWLWTY